MKSIFEHTLFINLAHRQDRKDAVMKELRKLGIENPQRFEALKLASGALGCSMSHLKCVQMAKAQGWKQVFICEDDIEFLDPTTLLQNLDKFVSRQKDWDVLLLAGNNMLPYQPVDDCCIQVRNCITTTGYIVREHYYDKLIANYKAGIEKLMKAPQNTKMFAVDKYWLSLQMEDRWFFLVPPTVVQRDDYSDVVGRRTNFRDYMLNYNKVCIT